MTAINEFLKWCDETYQQDFLKSDCLWWLKARRLADEEAKSKPQADASLVEELGKLIEEINWVEYDEVKPALEKVISRYRPTSQTGIVWAIKAKAKTRHISGGTTQAEGWVTENEIEEIIRKFEGEKGEK